MPPVETTTPSSAAAEKPTATRKEAPAKTFSRPAAINADTRKFFDPTNKLVVGGNILAAATPKEVKLPDGATDAEKAQAHIQADVDAHVDGFFNTLTAAVNTGLDQAVKDGNIAELVAFGKDKMHIDPEELADRLTAQGVDAKQFLPDLQQDASADKLANDASEQTENVEQAEQGERVKRMMQEAKVVGQRIVGAELGAMAGENDGVRAYLWLRDVQQDTLDPQKAILSEGTPLDQANLPMVTVDIGGKGNIKTVGIRQIMSITTDAQGQRIAHVKFERPSGNGGIGHGEADIPMDHILEAQVLAEAKNFSGLLAGNPDEQAAFGLYVATLTGGEAAKNAFSNTEQADKTLLSAAQQVGLLTREDIKIYVANMKNQLPKKEDGTIAPEGLPESRALDSLDRKVANVTLVTPDIVQSIVMDGLQIGDTGSAADLKQKHATAVGTVKNLQEQLRQLERNGENNPDTLNRKDALREALQKAINTQQQIEVLQVVAGVGEAGENGTAGSIVAEYFNKLKAGEVSVADAVKTMEDFRNGDYLNFLNSINRMKPLPGESADAYMGRIAEEEKRRKQLLSAGSGAGLVILIMASLATSLVNPQG